MMEIIKFILGIIKWVILIGTTMLALYVVSSSFNIFGGYRPYLVQSGSMEPAIMTGDIIIVKDQINYSINDVITFTNNSGRVVTHRIVAVEQKQEKKYSTKGDANRAGDEDMISDEQVIGKVILVIPKLGYLVAYTKSSDGLLYLLIIPAIVFILDELLKVKKYAKTGN